MKPIAGTGLIVALLNRRDRFHSWALDAFTRFAPFFTCDAVLVESASFFPTPNPVLTLVERGDLVLDAGFVLSRELPAVHALTAKYADAPMDLADAASYGWPSCRAKVRSGRWTARTSRPIGETVATAFPASFRRVGNSRTLFSFPRCMGNSGPW